MGDPPRGCERGRHAGRYPHDILGNPRGRRGCVHGVLRSLLVGGFRAPRTAVAAEQMRVRGKFGAKELQKQRGPDDFRSSGPRAASLDS